MAECERQSVPVEDLMAAFSNSSNGYPGILLDLSE